MYRKDNPHLTVRALARNLGISAPTFYKWQKAAKQNDGDVLHWGFQYVSKTYHDALKRYLVAVIHAKEILWKMPVLTRFMHWSKENGYNSISWRS